MKNSNIIIALCIGLFLGITSTALANTDYVQAQFSKFNFVFDGEDVKVSDPLLYEGRTYLPVRDLLETIGYDVDYIDETRTITADSMKSKEGVKMNTTSIDSPAPFAPSEAEIEIKEIEDRLQVIENSIKTAEDALELDPSLESFHNALERVLQEKMELEARLQELKEQE